MKPRWTSARGLPVHEKGAGNMKGMSVPTSQEAKISCDILRRSFATSWPSRIGRSQIQHVELELVWGAGGRAGERRTLVFAAAVAASCCRCCVLCRDCASACGRFSSAISQSTGESYSPSHTTALLQISCVSVVYFVSYDAL
jgi:hypothetical protein